MKSVKYIVENPRDALWGLSITTVGYECYKANDPTRQRNIIQDIILTPTKDVRYKSINYVISPKA